MISTNKLWDTLKRYLSPETEWLNIELYLVSLFLDRKWKESKVNLFKAWVSSPICTIMDWKLHRFLVHQKDPVSFVSFAVWYWHFRYGCMSSFFAHPRQTRSRIRAEQRERGCGWGGWGGRGWWSRWGGRGWRWTRSGFLAHVPTTDSGLFELGPVKRFLLDKSGCKSCNQCKWRHLVAKFASNAKSVTLHINFTITALRPVKTK